MTMLAHLRIDSLLCMFRLGDLTFYLLSIISIADPRVLCLSIYPFDVFCLLKIIIALMVYCLPDSFSSSNKRNEDVFVTLWRSWTIYGRKKNKSLL